MSRADSLKSAEVFCGSMALSKLIFVVVADLFSFVFHSLEQELTHYSVLHKGDTINIQYGGRDYAIDIIETRPDDQICCVETNIELDFEAPKDYVEPPKIQKQTSTQRRAVEE